MGTESVEVLVGVAMAAGVTDVMVTMVVGVEEFIAAAPLSDDVTIMTGLREVTASVLLSDAVTKVVGVGEVIAAVSLNDAVTRGAARPKTRRRWLQLLCMLSRCLS